MTRKLKDSGIEWIGEIPEDWEVHKIGNYYIQLKDKNKNLQERNLLSLSYGNIINKNINTSDGLLPDNFSNYNIVNENDIVLRMTDLQNDKRSLRTGLVNEKGIITSAYITLRCKKSQLIHSKYIYFLLHAFDINKGFYGMGSGVRQNVNFNDIKKISIIYPSIVEQEKIINNIEIETLYTDKIVNETEQSIKELKKYKQSLITEAVTKGLDPNVEMKDSGIEWIGKVPTNWIISNISRISTLSSGGTPSSGNEEYYDGEIPWVRSLDLNEQEIFSTDRNLSEEGFSVISGGMVQKGSIVIAMYGGEGTIGNSGILDFDASTNQAICSIRLNKQYNERFYFYYIRFLRPYWMIYAVGTRKDPNISKQIVQKMPCIIPSIEEQQQIVSYLDEQTSRINKLIEDKTKIIGELEDYKKSLIYEYVTGKKEV